MDNTANDLTKAISLLERYHDSCHCRGDQYGSPGLCMVCQEARVFIHETQNGVTPNA